MHKATLIKYMCKLTKPQVSDFRDFVWSPYHNKHKDVRKLTEYLCKHFPDLEAEIIDRKTVYEVLFPGETFDYGRLRHIISYTLDCLEKFAALEQLRMRPFLLTTYTLADLRKKNLRVRYEALYTRTAAMSDDAMSVPDIENFLLHKEGHSFYNRHQHPLDLEIMHRQMNLLDQIYWREKLFLACDLWGNPEYKMPYKGYFPEWMQYLATQYDYFETFVEVKTAYHLAQTLLAPDEDEYFKKGMEQLREDAIRMSPDYYHHFLSGYLSFAENRAQSLSDKYLRHYYYCSKAQIDNLWLKEEGYFSTHHYIEIIRLGLHFEDFQFIVKFMDQYMLQLPQHCRDNCYHRALAMYYYHTRQYNLSLKWLDKISPSGPLEELEQLILPIKIYFETRQNLPFIRSMRRYYRWKKCNTEKAEHEFDHYDRFFKLTEEAFQLIKEETAPKNRKHSRFKINIKEELSKISRTAHVQWLKDHVVLVFKSAGII